MKFVIVALLLIGMISCQASVEVCTTDLKDGVKVVKALEETIKTKDIFKTITYISMIQPMIQKVKSDCSSVTKADIFKFVYGKLNDAQKACLTDVMSVFFVGSSVVEDFKTKNWAELFKDISTLTKEVQNAKTVCTGAF